MTFQISQKNNDKVGTNILIFSYIFFIHLKNAELKVMEVEYFTTVSINVFDYVNKNEKRSEMATMKRKTKKKLDDFWET